MPFDLSPAEVTQDGPVADALVRAKARIATKEHWFQGATGRTLPSTAGSAPTVDCVATALLNISDKAQDALKVFAEANAVPRVYSGPNGAPGNVVHWNNADERQWEDIHPAFDRAIAYARERGL